MSFAFELPPALRERLKEARKKLSPAAYEKLREKVKGPEDLERELMHMDKLASLKFNLESEPEIKEKLKAKIREDIDREGLCEVLDADAEVADFDVSIEEDKVTHEDLLVVYPEGNVSEKVPVKPAFSEKYLAQFTGGGSGKQTA